MYRIVDYNLLNCVFVKIKLLAGAIESIGNAKLCRKDLNQ